MAGFHGRNEGIALETTTVMRELPERIKHGDAQWIKEQFEQGNLDELEPLVAVENWDRLGVAIRAGDMDTVREILRDVNVPGVGPLVPPSKTWLWVLLSVGGVALVALVIWRLVNDGDDTVEESTSGTVAETTTTEEAPEGATENIVQVLAANPQYSTLSSLLTQSGLATLLADTGPYTVFAPDNAAFDALPADQMTYLQSDNALLRQVLAYHGVFGQFPTDVLEPGELNTAEGQPVTIAVAGTGIEVNTATIVQPDLAATNGVVQGINQVLVPPGVTLAPPTPPPTPTTAPPATTTTTGPGTTTTAGPGTTTTTEATTTTEVDSDNQNLYEVLAADPHFDLFVDLIDAAGLEETLADTEEITVFAPTDGAFGGDPEDAAARVDRIIDEMPEDDLADLLLYQSVPDVLLIDSLEPGDLETFLTGQAITVIGTGDTAEIQGADNPGPGTILASDILASNGVAHGITEFLLPSDIAVPD